MSVVRKRLRRIRKFCCLSTDKPSKNLEAMSKVPISLVPRLFSGEGKEPGTHCMRMRVIKDLKVIRYRGGVSQRLRFEG